MISLRSLLDANIRHIRLAARTFLRHGRTHLTVTAILALGIGMSVAMFSLVDAVLLRPLPFSRQESIYVIWKANPLAGDHIEELAYPELLDLQENVRGFEYVAVMPTSLYGYGKVLQVGTAEPVQLESAPVSHDFFRVLGVSPVLGRDFESSDEGVGVPPVTVVSDRVWRDQLGADPNIVGQIIRLNGQGHTVIGVMAPGVEFPRGVDLWVPLGIEQRVVERRGATFLQAIARAEPGFSHGQIESEVGALFQRLAADYPEVYSPAQQGVVTPLVQYWTGSARLHLWIMLGASVLLFLASTITSINLLLSRTTLRRSEIATRLALGAQFRHVLAQLAIEGVAIASTAAVAGLCMARLAIWFLVRWAPADIPRLTEAGLDLDSYCFAAGAAALAAVVCSTVPAFSAGQMKLETALREGGVRSSISHRAQSTRNMFILAQGAVTVALLVMSVLLVVSYRSLTSTDPGFANRDTATMEVLLRGPGLFGAQAFDKESRQAFYSRLLDRLRQTPGVTSAAAILMRPLEGPVGWDIAYELEFESGTGAGSVLPKGNYEVVTPGYFETVGTPLLEGRDFDEYDSGDGEPVIIISRKLAERIRASGYDPIGHRVRLFRGSPIWRKVVGVCADARYRNITQSGVDIFVPYLQAWPPTKYVVIRGTRSAQELVALVRTAVSEIDPSQAVGNPATIGELIDRSTSRHQFNMVLLLWFAVCAATLAAMGVYSVIVDNVTARESEIAIRNALGAQRPRLVFEMVSSTLRFALIGQVLGALSVVSFGALISGLLYGVSPLNPVVLGSVTGFLFFISIVAAFFPAWNAAGLDPKASLRTS